MCQLVFNPMFFFSFKNHYPNNLIKKRLLVKLFNIGFMENLEINLKKVDIR